MRRRELLAALAALLGSGVAAAAELPADPLNSPVWPTMARRYLGDAPVQFDARVQVLMPASAEDALAVPVEIRASGLGPVEQVLVFADLNPLPHILDYYPRQARPDLQFRFKVEQSTPVRAALRTRDGVWHVGGAWLSAAGGGCTAPSQGTGSGLWQERLGAVSGRLWSRNGGGERLRLRVIHPMDTGLAPGIPVFHIESLSLRDAQDRELALFKPYEPVSENPILSFDLDTDGPVRVVGRDIQGNLIRGEIAARAAGAAAPGPAP